MSINVAIIDYGMGNVCSVGKALNALGASHVLTADAEEIGQASHVILPGVGHFGHGMQELQRLNLIPVIKQQVLLKPVLGICLGMQLLFDGSEEAPGTAGLGLISGKLQRFKAGLPVPHVGWNDVYGKQRPAIFDGIEECSNFYFVHSYHALLAENVPHMLTDYGIEVLAAVQKGKLSGTQFHPEKSQKKGLAVLKNFLAQD